MGRKQVSLIGAELAHPVILLAHFISHTSFLDQDEIPVYDPDDKEEHVFSERLKEL